ncbi:MAG: aspartate aminotransferase family protein [Candidatus Riflebacteria bacterium]|nr:aspartate aminotransferase family protein [Candidatus Riflebacteria bacterium]
MELDDDPEEPAFPPFVRPYYEQPLTVARASGTRLWDLEGRSYLDGYCGVATVVLGHCHEQVDRAAHEQARTFGHVSAIYRSDLTVSYARELLRALGGGLRRVFFVNSGSEAVDLALCLARVAAGSEHVVALADGYHGGTYLSKSATGLGGWHFRSAVAPAIALATTPNCHGCPHRACAAGGQPCLADLARELGSIKARGETPIVLLEPVLGVGGIVIPPDSYFAGLMELKRETGAVLVVDEVQTGFGRCGGRLFGFQKVGLTPDLVALGKGIANGYPLGAVAMTRAVAEADPDLLHFNTFGGHPASIAAARQTLSILSSPGFLDGVAVRGELFLRSEGPGATCSAWSRR